MARGQDDQLDYVAAGEEILAEHYNRLVDVVRRVSDSEDYYADGIGTTHLPPLVSPCEFVPRWGKNDTLLTPGGTAIVSLWCGITANDNDWSGWDHDSGDNVTARLGPVYSYNVAADTFLLLLRMYGGRWVVWDDYC